MLTAALVLVAVFVGWSNLSQTNEAFKPHYLTYRGADSRIFLVSETESHTYTNQTFSADNQTVAEGTPVYVLDLTLRNDYSSDNPPPTSGTQVAPVDGTAYICLSAVLLNGNVVVPAVNISPSDFSTTSADSAGFVLASGETIHVQLVFVTNETEITSFSFSLVFLGDSIPS